MSHQSKIYCGLKVDWIDRLVRECRVEGLHLYLRESGTLQLMTAWSLGLKISNLCLVFFFPTVFHLLFIMGLSQFRGT